ncbi:MAG: N-formylglutamate amidohydrolase [Candidatus Nanopelagicales bacterium]
MTDDQAWPAEGDACARFVPGSPNGSVLLHVPHSSRLIPAWVRERILLSGAELAAEIDRMRDSYTDVIAERAAAQARVRPHMFVNELARQVVDPERFPDEREAMAQIGHGAVYLNTSQLTPLRADDPQHVAELLDRYFHPYARRMTDEVQEILNARGQVTVLDIHSFPREALPYEQSGGPRPSICLGVDEFHTPPGLIDAAREAFSEFDIEINTPFAGTYVPLKFYERDRQVRGLMIEVRRDVCEEQQALMAVQASLARLVDTVHDLRCAR